MADSAEICTALFLIYAFFHLKVNHKKIIIDLCVWTFVENGGQSKKRYGHTSHSWENKIIFVGGSRMYNKDLKRRECLNDILIYDPAAKVWTEIIPSGAYLEPRRHHASCLVGNFLVVNGGQNDKEVFLDDTLALNLAGLENSKNEIERGYRWIQLKINFQPPGKLAYHTCQLVIASERVSNSKQLTLTSLPELRYGKSSVLFIFICVCRFNMKAFISLEAEMIQSQLTKFMF